MHTQPRARGMSIAVVGTLFAAIAGGILTTSAFSPRYAAVVFLPLLLLVALGTTTFLSTRVRLVVVAVAVVAGLIGSVQNVTTQRTQATAVSPRSSMPTPSRATSSPSVPTSSGRPSYRAVADPGPLQHGDLPPGDRAASSSTGSTTPAS